MLLHAQHHWPGATTTNLWPYALRTTCEVFNDTPTLKGEHKKTPRELFTRTRISAKVRHHHAFGCLVYVLVAPLQSGKKSLSAWMSQARVGINLYISPTHTHSVALVLSLKITTTGTPTHQGCYSRPRTANRRHYPIRTHSPIDSEGQGEQAPGQQMGGMDSQYSQAPQIIAQR
jgi:hypothetical protein